MFHLHGLLRYDHLATVKMVARPRERPLTNAEGFEIPHQRPSPRLDRYVYILLGVLQLVAAAVIAKQLKDLGVLPEWVNTDLSTVQLCS